MLTGSFTLAWCSVPVREARPDYRSFPMDFSLRCKGRCDGTKSSGGFEPGWEKCIGRCFRSWMRWRQCAGRRCLPRARIAMDLVIFEDNKPFVVKALQNGDFDYMEAASEVVEADFFRFIKA
mgnify:CR=1 FL=1